MRKIENPSEYEVCKISEWGESTGVYMPVDLATMKRLN